MANVNIYAPTAEDGLNAYEISLYNDLMAYRASLGLPSIPLSKALTATAGRHAVDIADNLGTPVEDQSPGENRAHSWSDAPYNAKDTKTYANMYGAPARLGTGYAGAGYENLITGTGTVVHGSPAQTSAILLNAWKMSPGHNAVMTNQGDWKPYTWNAVGVSVYKNTAALWFGREADPTGTPSIDGFDPLRYLASNGDLMNAFGTNQQAAKDHYLAAGAHEGRSTTAFNPMQYLAGNGDLMNAFGTDAGAAESHYILTGRTEGRTDKSFAADGYLASNADLLAAFGNDREAAAKHYIQAGRFEGRKTDQFNAQAYEQANADIARAFGSDLAAATRHYIDYGYKEGRPTRPANAPTTGTKSASIQLLQDGSDLQGSMVSEFQSGSDALVLDHNPFKAAAAPVQRTLTITSGLNASGAASSADLLTASSSFASTWDGASLNFASAVLAGYGC